MQVPALGWEGPLDEEMAIHSSILAWKIPWTENPGGYSPWGSQRIGHYLVTKQQQKQGMSYILKSHLITCVSDVYIGLAKMFVWVFLEDVMKNPNKLFGHPDKISARF